MYTRHFQLLLVCTCALAVPMSNSPLSPLAAGAGMGDNQQVPDYDVGPDQGAMVNAMSVPGAGDATTMMEVGASASMMTGANIANQQLSTSLDEIKNDIVLNAQDLKHEVEWTKQVDKLLTTYKSKRENVYADVIKLRARIKDLLKKKRKVENLMLQNELEAQLAVGTEDLKTLDSAVASVSAKQKGFVSSRADVESTVKKLEDALAKLKGGRRG